MLAAWNGFVQCVELLLDKGADVNISDCHGDTPLIHALDNGSYECVKLLLDKGADVNVRNNDGNTPLIYAAEKGSHECVKLLLDKGDDVNVGNNDGGTPLIYAARKGSHECVKLLLDKGADVNVGNNIGCTPLLYAAFEGSNECSKVLLAAGANANSGCNTDGETPLMHAVYYGVHESVNALIAAGADVNCKDKCGKLVLFYALSGSHRNDLKMTDFRFIDPIYLALKIRQGGIVAQLIEAGANVNAWFERLHHEYYKPYNPLIHFARERVWPAEYEKIMSPMTYFKLLLKAGVHVNKKYMDCNALAWYCYNPHNNAMILYLDQNEHPNEIILMLLYAAGEVVEWSEVEDWAFLIPECLQGAEAVKKRKKCASLRDLCRVSIRSRFLNLDRHTNLFIRVPKLGLPSLLTRYLLFDMTLDICTEEDNIDNKHDN